MNSMQYVDCYQLHYKLRISLLYLTNNRHNFCNKFLFCCNAMIFNLNFDAYPGQPKNGRITQVAQEEFTHKGNEIVSCGLELLAMNGSMCLVYIIVLTTRGLD